MTTGQNPHQSLASAFKVARVKSLATLIASVTGLLIALSAMLKPRDDRATKQSYETLVHEIKELSQESQQQHDDLVSMRAYLDGYVRGTVPLNTQIVDAGAAGAGADSTVTVHAPEPVRPPRPPVLAPRPKPVAPPAFAKIKGQADLL